MSIYPYIDQNPGLTTGVIKMYQRIGSHPLDPTTVFNTKAQLLEYINMPGSYAYPGQIVAVANGALTIDNNNDYSLYIIKSDKSIQPIQTQLSFSTVEDVESFIESNPGIIPIGTVFTINGILYNITDDENPVQLVSVSASDNIHINWNNVDNKPTTINELGISNIVSTEQLDEINDIEHYHYCENKFKSVMLTETLSYIFDFLLIETFYNTSFIDLAVAEGLFIKDTLYDTTNHIIKKIDNSTKTFITNEFNFINPINQVWIYPDYSGVGNVNVYLLYNDNEILLPASTLFSIGEFIDTDETPIKLKFELIGNVTLCNFGMGVKM